MSLPKEDLSYSTKNMMFEEIVSLLGGRVSEELMLEDISTGASNDIQRATTIANLMVTRYGMSDKLGPILYGNESNEVFLGYDLAAKNSYSEHVAAQIDEEVKSIIDKAYQTAKKILTDNNDKLIKVADTLLEKEKISGDEFKKILEGDVIETVTVDDFSNADTVDSIFDDDNNGENE